MRGIGQDDLVKEYRERFVWLYGGVIVALSLILLRLWYLQIFRGEQFGKYSEMNRLRQEKVVAPRGLILDREGQVLADNKLCFNVVITPQFLKQPAATIARLSTLIGIPVPEIMARLKKQAQLPSFQPRIVMENVDREVVAKVEFHNLDLPGVSIDVTKKRSYPFGEETSHMLGYIGLVTKNQLAAMKDNDDEKPYDLGDYMGQSGIEEKWEGWLRGWDGTRYVEVDAKGRKTEYEGGEALFGSLPQTEVKPGRNLVLTVDADLQSAAVRAFGEGVGALVALNPRNGQVLAMVSRPGFDPTELSYKISPELWNKYMKDPDHPLRNKVIQDHYPPGSTFKLVVSIAGLEEGVIDPLARVNCSGLIKLGRKDYHCHVKQGHGSVNFFDAVTRSCNVFFYKQSMKLGIDTIKKYANLLGLGELTNIGFRHEQRGLIPSTAWKVKVFKEEWMMGETLSCAIGQGFVLATPLQLANAYATIANGGTLYRPYIVQRIEDHAGNVVKVYQPVVIRKMPFKRRNIDLLIKGLTRVFNTPNGTGYYRRIPDVFMAGKTGTSQVIRFSKEDIYDKCEGMDYRNRNHGLIVSFAPAYDPEILVVALHEHSCHGASGAGPIALEVMQTYFKKRYGSDFAANFKNEEFARFIQDDNLLSYQHKTDAEPGKQGGQNSNRETNAVAGAVRGSKR